MRCRYNDAKRWFQYAIDVLKALHGPVHNDLAILITSLAIVLKEMGLVQEAVLLYEQALSIRRQLCKGQSPLIAQVCKVICHVVSRG